MSYQLPAVLNSRLNSLLSHAAVVRPVRAQKQLRHSSECDTALCYSRDIWRCSQQNYPNNEICTRLRHEAGAQGAALYSHAQRSARSRPAKRRILCVAISDRAPPRWYSVLGRLLVDLRIVLRVVGQLALARLRTFWRHVLAIEDRNKREGTRHSNCWGRHYSSIGLFKARSCQMVDRMRTWLLPTASVALHQTQNV